MPGLPGGFRFFFVFWEVESGTFGGGGTLLKILICIKSGTLQGTFWGEGTAPPQTKTRPPESPESLILNVKISHELLILRIVILL